MIIFNKPFNTISQFSKHPNYASLSDWIHIPNIYPAGRLDADSEGLLLLTDQGALQAQIANPRYRIKKYYWVQVEGVPSQEALHLLIQGLLIKGKMMQAIQAKHLDDSKLSSLWEHTPSIRFRQNTPTTWIEIILTEGKNRQIRKMTAAIGYPTLRLIRIGIGQLNVFKLRLQPGEYKFIPPSALNNKLI